MNYLIYMLSLIGFLVLPGLLLAIRLLREKIMPWWLLILLVLILSWGLLNSGVHSYYEYLFDLIESTPDPSQELLDEFGSDGAKLVFTLFFGWLYGCVYLVPWLLIYRILRFLQRKWSASSNRDTNRWNHIPTIKIWDSDNPQLNKKACRLVLTSRQAFVFRLRS